MACKSSRLSSACRAMNSSNRAPSCHRLNNRQIGKKHYPWNKHNVCNIASIKLLTDITALFNNKQTLGNSAQSMVLFFATVDPLVIHSKVHVRGLWLVDLFHGPLVRVGCHRNFMIDSSEKRNIIVSWVLNFRVRVLLKGVVKRHVLINTLFGLHAYCKTLSLS